ncbi:MAG TPA: POTRA domain-containing protein [Pyrinomonadaceae bacterium]
MAAAFVAAPGRRARAANASEIGEYDGRLVSDVQITIEGPASDPANPCAATTATLAAAPTIPATATRNGATPAMAQTPRDPAVEGELLTLLRVAPNSEYSTVRVRESLEALFREGQVACARLEVRETGGAGSPLRLRFIVRRQVKVGEVRLAIGAIPPGSLISEDELRARLNMLEPGARLSVQTLRTNADLIQAYLRDRGFYRAEVDYSQELDPSGARAAITFNITPGEQATVSAFNIDIKGGFDPAPVRPTLRLTPGAHFTREVLSQDVQRVRLAIIRQGYLAPQLEDPEVTLDATGKLVNINLKGSIGPKVTVTLRDYELKEKTQRELLPILREGTIDWSAIEEGSRRLRNRLQQDGWFFANVEAVCNVTPKAPPGVPNGTSETCENLNPADLSGSNVGITYNVERGRRFKLTEIRITGTDQLTLDDVEDDLKTQKANVLGFIPLLGYGRGYTSRERLEDDRRTIRARMRDLGYRSAEVEVRQGVSLEGENLVITFAVTEGPLTRVAGVEIRGNQIYTEARLREEINSPQCRDRLRSKDPDTNERLKQEFRTVVGAPFSRTSARADGDCILNLYARDGYIDAQLDFSIVELPRKGDDEQVRIVYTISDEGDKVFINRIVINGYVITKREAILKTITLVEGDILRADRITESERLLYATDAFRQVIIRTENAGETASGFRKRDVIIDVEETRPRILDYGGGYSTDNGPLGFIELRNSNLFGQLRQGAVRLRASRREQLLRFEYYDPRFRPYGAGETRRFMPLSLSLQYQRDSTVTRFFRSTIDRGNFGIVQRLDSEGEPIDINCALPDETQCRTGEPTINRFTFNAETQRSFARNTRSTLFLRYNYEDVRLFNINSLLIAPILYPDRAIRLSRLGATFVRDTRDSQFDATRGEYLTLDYGLALRQLGGNLSFNKFQVNYRRYYKIGERIRRSTVLAGNITLGLANLFNPRDRNDNGVIDDIDRTLPISERFFSGGSTTLRGFGYEEAGPRQVIQGGIFRNQQGEPVTLQPFLVPVGGNALAVVNLEARTALTKAFQVVPFYDGGNVFRSIGDIFGRELKPGQDPNLLVKWTHTVGLGLRIKTPIGGALAIDYGYLLNPPEFTLDPTAREQQIIRLKPSQLHFRFTQTF